MSSFLNETNPVLEISGRFFVRDGILYIANYNSTHVGVVVAVIVVVVNFAMG